LKIDKKHAKINENVRSFKAYAFSNGNNRNTFIEWWKTRIENGLGKKQIMGNRSPRKPPLMVEDLSVSVGGFARWND